MSTFTLSIQLGDEAMSSGTDVGRALEKLGLQINMGSKEFEAGSITDDNGNKVGSYSYGEESRQAIIVNEQVIELPTDVLALVAATFSRDADTVEAVDATWAKLREIFPASLAPEPDEDGVTRIEGAV